MRLSYGIGLTALLSLASAIPQDSAATADGTSTHNNCLNPVTKPGDKPGNGHGVYGGNWLDDACDPAPAPINITSPAGNKYDNNNLPVNVHTYPPYLANRVRIMVFFTRNSSVDATFFHQYWRTHHAKLWGDLDIVRKNLLKYEQIHFDVDNGTAGLASLGFPGLQNQLGTNFDGVVLFDAESYENFATILNSDEYKNIIAPNEALFLNRTLYLAFPGQIVPVFDKTSDYLNQPRGHH